MRMEIILAVVLVTFVAGTVSMAAVRPILARRQVLDIPNHRSSHSQPTVRGGGFGITIGLLAGLGLGALLLGSSSVDINSLVAVGFTVSALAAVGFAEDILVGLPVWVRLGAQALVVVIASAGVVLVQALPVLLGLLAGLAGVFYVNAANFMDGVNGISSLHGAVVGAYFAFVGHLNNDPALMLTSAAIGVAFLSFLPWNAPRARMFMGDVGSYALGGSAWALSVWALSGGVSLATAAAPLAIYSADVAVTLARRAAQGASLTQAHREHVYQQVQQITHSHLASTGVTTVATIVCACLGVWNLLEPVQTHWVISGMVVVACAYLVTPQLLAHRPALVTSGQSMTQSQTR